MSYQKKEKHDQNAQHVLSMSGNKQKQIKVGELVLFDKYFIDENISYKNGIFTFKKSGIYNVNFSIYLENMKMPSADINVNSDSEKFIVSIKGIDDISTAHSMVIPCSFSRNFIKGENLKLKNVSSGIIYLMPNFNKGIGSIISINKIN
jgi:hypothetical protein